MNKRGIIKKLSLLLVLTLCLTCIPITPSNISAEEVTEPVDEMPDSVLNDPPKMVHRSTKYDKGIELDKSVAYLYIFEKGIPIAVTFTESGYANGQFLLLSDSKSYEDISDIFNKFSCKVDKIK